MKRSSSIYQLILHFFTLKDKSAENEKVSVGFIIGVCLSVMYSLLREYLASDVNGDIFWNIQFTMMYTCEHDR